MLGSEFYNFPYWLLFPIVMIILCFLVMRGRRGAMMCGFGSRGTDNHKITDSNSAIEILDKRYALGEINKEEYEEKRSVLRQVPETEKVNSELGV
jgi:putative membrane protein